MRYVRGGHADGPWRPLADGASFTIWLDGEALRVDPANEAAVTAKFGVPPASVADYLALASGVAEADLALLKAQAPLLVARAAESERLDWMGFLSQAQAWWRQQANRGLEAAG